MPLPWIRDVTSGDGDTLARVCHGDREAPWHTPWILLQPERHTLQSQVGALSYINEQVFCFIGSDIYYIYIL